MITPLDPAAFEWADDLVTRSVFEAAHEVVARSFGVQAKAVIWEADDAQPHARTWRGRTLIDAGKLNDGQRLAVALSGLIAKQLTVDLSADSLSVINAIDGSLITEADAGLLDGLDPPTAVQLVDAVQLVRRHWPEIEQRTFRVVAKAVAANTQHSPVRYQ